MPINVYDHETKTHTPTYVGLVVSLFEVNGSWDSDFFAMVWDPETKSLQRVMYDTTRGAMYGSASVDASPEILAEVEAMRQRHRDEYNAEREQLLAQLPEKGAKARVDGIKGKKAVLNGAEGVVFWCGEDKYSKHEIRVGVEINGEKHFFNGRNVYINGSEKSAYDADRSWSVFKRVSGALASHIRGYYN